MGQISDFILLLLMLSIVGSLNFLLIFWIHKSNKNDLSNRFVYFLLKVLLLYMLVPMLFFIFALRELSRVQNVFVYGEDYHLAKIITSLSLETVVEKSRNLQILATVIFVLWLLGFIYLFGYKVLSAYYKLRIVQDISIDCNDSETESIKNSILEELHITKNIVIRISRDIGSPFIAGLRNVKIFLPDMELSEQDKRFIIYHEAIHYKKRDIVFKNLMLFLQAIYWFNPFICFFKEYFFELSEVACDEEVLRNGSKEMCYEYGLLIIHMLEQQNKSYNLVFFSDYDEIKSKWRLQQIMTDKKSSIRWLAAILTIICVLACPITTFGVTVETSSLEDQFSRQALSTFTMYESGQAIQMDEEFTYVVDRTRLSSETNQAVTRGSNYVDCTLNGDDIYLVEDLYLSKGNTVQFILASANSSHQFKAGVMDANGKIRAVKSSNGTISHTFTITTSGDYSLMIEGITDAEININGSIVIR